MARRTFTEFDEELLLKLANRTDITAALRARLIHDAYVMVANEFPHPELQGVGAESIASGTSELTPTSITDMAWPEFVKDITNNRPIDLSSRDDLENQDRTISGVITKFYWFNRRFYWDRASNATVTIRVWYKKEVAEMSATGSPVFSRDYDPLITMRAAQLGLSAVGMQKEAHIEETAYRNYVVLMRFPTYENEKNDRRQSIRVRMR